jgi:hypothetical protein
MKDERPRWHACIDCGIEKNISQSRCPKCKSCALKRKNPRWDACIDCGIKKINGETWTPVCKSCAQIRSWQDDSIREKRTNRINEVMMSTEFRQKRSETMKGVHDRPGYKEFFKETFSHPDVRIRRSIAQGGDGDIWRIDRAKNRESEYKQSRHFEWSCNVKQRDDYQCQHCGETSRKELHAHHIKPRALFPELCFEINNGMTLCKKCHIEEHKRMRFIKQNV